MDGDFVVSRIAKKPPCRSVLGAIRGRCKSMPDIEPLCLSAVERLEHLHPDVVHRSVEDPLRVQYVEMLVRLWKITYTRPLLVRLAKCDTMAQMIGTLQVDIDGLARGLGCGDDEVEMTKWRDEWKNSRAQQFSALKRLTTDSTDRELVCEIKKGARLEVMAELQNELGKKLPEEQRELIQQTFDRVAEFTKMSEVHSSDWMISVNDLIFDDGPVIVGSFGEIRRATWYHDGASQKVVVKQILSEIAGDARGAFTGQLDTWRELPEHPNILKLHGGCSVGPRQFYVCEDAAKGNLRDFCRVERNSVLIWRIMIQVAEGLAFLHQHGIVHGGLTCSNILIDSNNCPKLSDFGFSTIRSLSMGMSVSRYHFQPQDLNEAIHGDSVTSQRIESDIYALGMCISEALEQTMPFGGEATDTSSNKIRRIISRLRALNYRDRLSVEDAISEMRDVFPEGAAFPIDGLNRSPSSLKVLNEIVPRFRRVPESEKLCRQLLDRLQFLHDSVAPMDATDPVKKSYTDVMVRFVKLMRPKPLLLRLANSQRRTFDIRELQLKLSVVAQSLGLADKPEATRWEQQWDYDCAKQYGKLNDLVTGATERMLVSEFRGDKMVQEALMTLKSGMKWKDQTPEMLALKQATFSYMSSYGSDTGLRVFDWFIPIDDVEYEDEAIGNRGTFGDVCRGSWIHDGERTEVVVKRLFPGTLMPSDDAFLRLLEMWWNLPDNEHILKLYGGSNVSTAQFYVCEDAQNGNLADILEDEAHSGLFWQLFMQAAEGLEFLHGHNVVHGALKCSNILVGRDSVKLADFGINNLGEGMFGMAVTAEVGQQRMLSMRWKPKEVLVDSDGSGPRYESDIYSLGMCMIEAKTGEPPFALYDDDEELMDRIMMGQMPERPEGLSDAEWDFICRLCHPDLSLRPTLKEVLDEIEKFAATEEAEMRLDDFFLNEPQIVSHSSDDPPKATEPPQQSSVCSSCTESSDGSQRSCRCCGFPLKTSDDNVTRHSFATYVKSHTKDEMLQRLYDVALTLQDLREQGVVHANVIPGSIRIGRDGCAQLVGFEFSKTLDELASGAVPKREDGLRYLAPECLSGKNPSFESDVYSLAMCAIYALSREPPWGLLTTDEELKVQILSLHAIPEKPETITDTEWRLVKQMCTYDPADRMHIADVVGCLAKLVSNASPEVPAWRLEPDLVKCPEADGAVSSRTPLVSRHLGQWKDAVVAVVKPEEGFFAMGRSFHSVADLWYSLKHPTIQQLYGAYDEKGMVFICENAERGELSGYLRSSLADSDVWKVLLDAALALHYMHCRGIVHGDIGFHNILVTADGRGKLSGFFLSSQQDGAHPCQCSPEDEPTTEEEWKPLACSRGHHAEYSSDVYWLGRCIIDAIGGELMRSKEMPSTSAKCARCSMGQLPSQPESFSVEEWGLVSDMCHGDIEMNDVVDRLARIAAVNVVVSSRLKDISTPLPSDARQKAQGMMLAKLRQYEEEDMKRQQSDDYDDYLDCDEDGDSNAQTMNSIEQHLAYAAREMFGGDNFVTALVEYDSKTWNISAIPPTHLKMPSVTWRKCPYQWALDHESIVEIKADEISQGGFATVWLGKWFGAPVALKRLSKRDQGQSLREEANLWFRVRHPHIVGLFGACCTGSHMFVCDLVEGGRLDHFRRGEPDPVVVWGLLHEAAVGLQGLHSFGIVHADLKCDNILVTRDKRAKLIDFGLSCLRSCDGGRYQGAPRWKAPECLEGGGPTFVSDVFSFAMCIIQAISGAHPWGNLIEAGVLYQVKEGKLPKQPTAFSSVQWELVKRMCRFKPEERLELDFVVKVLGYFAKRAPYAGDEDVEAALAKWHYEAKQMRRVWNSLKSSSNNQTER